jgi:hypothetical protein
LKTFRLVTLAILQGDGKQPRILDVDLIDGLIINKEDGDNHWMIEAFIDKKYFELFNQSVLSNKDIHFQATISKVTNDPASLIGNVKSINVLSEHISVLIDGLLVRNNKIDVAEGILTSLLDKGLQGESLLDEFKQKMNEKRKPSTTS